MANLHEFNSSLETTKAWLDDLMDSLETSNEGRAVRTLRVVLQELRDHMTVEETADFGAQLPLLIRGLFYEGWRPGSRAVKGRSKADFLQSVEEKLQGSVPVGQTEEVVRDVFDFLSFKVTEGEVRHVISNLPRELRELWPWEVNPHSHVAL